MSTINTNIGAMAALQNLNATNRQLGVTQNRINTGLLVASTKDDSAAYAIAQKLRGDQLEMKAVTNSLNRAKSVVDVAVNGAEEIGSLLDKMTALAKEAADVSVTDESRAAINRDFKDYRDTITTIVKSADFNGSNLLQAANGGTISALLTIKDGDSAAADWQADTLTVTNQGLDLGGTVVTVAATDELATAVGAGALVAKLQASQKAMKTVLSTLGSTSRRLDTQIAFNSKLADTMTSGIGNLVDADMAKESAALQALQVKQQLGVQALSIANQAPQTILSLFR